MEVFPAVFVDDDEPPQRITIRIYNTVRRVIGHVMRRMSSGRPAGRPARRGGGAKTAGGDPPQSAEDDPSDQLRRWFDGEDVSRLSPFAKTWRFSIETLTTAEEFEYLSEQARIRAIWIGRAA